MKKALSSVFKPKTNQSMPGRSKLEIADAADSRSSSKSVDNLKEVHISARPPPGVLKMKSSSSNALAEKNEKLSASKKSHLTHHFSREELDQSDSRVTQSASDRKLSYRSSTSNSIEQSMESSEPYVVTYSSPDEEENEPIVTSPGGSPPTRRLFEKHVANSSSQQKVVGENFKAKKSVSSNNELRRMQSSDVEYEESKSVSQLKARLEGEGFSASKSAAHRQDQRTMRVGESVRQQQSMAKSSAMQMHTEDMSAEKRSFAAKQQATTISQGMVTQQSKSSSSSSSHFVSKSASSMSSSTSSNMHQSTELSTMTSSSFSANALSMANEVNTQFGLLGLCQESAPSELFMIQDVSEPPPVPDTNVAGIEAKLTEFIDKLKNASGDETVDVLTVMQEMLRKAWLAPGMGHDLGTKLSDTMKESGGLDLLVTNCASEDEALQLLSAQTLQYCLSERNSAYLATKGSAFVSVVRFACASSQRKTLTYVRAGTGLLAQLFTVSEEVCKELIKAGALDTILTLLYRSSDIETQRNCVSAIANLALFGGKENHTMMVKEKVPEWLLIPSNSIDDYVRYNAFIAIVALAANKEVEAAVLKSPALCLVEPFVMHTSAQEFAARPMSRVYGQSKSWLKKLVTALDSDREEAMSLAAFHFAVVAHVRKGLKNPQFFSDIGAIEALKRVASSPNALASKYAAQALKIIGEEVPHKLSQQVPLWTSDDVREWVKQIGFNNYAQEFVNSRVDGDLLLQLTEEMLKEDIGIRNGILRRRFLRELGHLKRITDYSSCDNSNIYDLLNSLGPVYAEYTYSMLQCGVDEDTLHYLSEDQLDRECRVANSIHRIKIAERLKALNQTSLVANNNDAEKSLDVFVSYRRSNGSQLASLLKVLLQMRGFSTFIDVERLEAGKFDCNLINSIKQAKHFLLILTPNALDRCINDTECKDWIHKEIVEALKNDCNIIPVLENFEWPEAEKLPEDMRAVTRFNAIRWIHEYQDACVDKLDRFMKGILASTELEQHNMQPNPGTPNPANRTNPGYQRIGSNDVKGNDH